MLLQSVEGKTSVKYTRLALGAMSLLDGPLDILRGRGAHFLACD